jgi:hypothetical protein
MDLIKKCEVTKINYSTFDSFQSAEKIPDPSGVCHSNYM